MKITENRLRRLIRSLLLESFKSEDIGLIKGVIDKLNFASKELIDDLHQEQEEDDFYIYIVDKLDKAVKESGSGFKYLDEGAFRAVYAVPSQDWVLKLASSVEGAMINKQEVEMSDGVHGLGARDIFVKVYDYDKFNELPWWVICQRVIPLTEVEDIELLKKVFPTFWNFLNSVTNKENIYYLDIVNDVCSFTGFISRILIKCIIKSQKVKKPTKDDKGWDYLYDKQKPPYYSKLSYKGLSEKMIYNAVKQNFGGELLPFEEISFGSDIKKLSQGLAYVGTTDLHDGNIGIVKSINPSPEDIIILDFDVES